MALDLAHGARLAVSIGKSVQITAFLGGLAFVDLTL